MEPGILLNVTTWRLVKRLYKGYLKKNLRNIAVNIVLLMVVAAVTGYQPLLLQQAFDKVFHSRDITYLTLLPVAMIILSVVQAVTNYYSGLLMITIGTELTADLRTDLYKHIINNDLNFHTSHRPGSLLHQVAGETVTISAGVQRFFTLIKHLATSVGLVAVMLYLSVEITCIVFGICMVMYYPFKWLAKTLKPIVHQFNKASIALNTRLLESFESIRLIKAFAKEDVEINIVRQHIAKNQLLNHQIGEIAKHSPALVQAMTGIIIAFVIWYGGFQLMYGRMTEGNLIAFMAALTLLVKPVRVMNGTDPILVEALVSAESYFTLLDAKPSSKITDESAKIFMKTGLIRFENVSFHYPDGANALKQVSFDIEPNKMTALVGRSGSGKSTVFNLLLRFYEPSNGAISIDNQNISDVSAQSVRASIALVPQVIFLFYDTIWNNISYGNDKATPEEILEAAKATKCHDFIMKLPLGYDTKLGDAGLNLSEGQRQRIAIARAFIRKSSLLLLDEPMSALDPKTDAEVWDSLKQLTSTQTTVIIAHRLSTVLRADKLIMLEDGAVKATGTHEQLLNNYQAYRDLFGM